MLGGTMILDDTGVIVWIERPFEKPASFYIGKQAWDFSLDESSRLRAQEMFAWTLTMGTHTQTFGVSGSGVSEQNFRYDFQRIGTRERFVICRFALHRSPNLTPTEEKIVRLLVRDMQQAEIGHALGISANTVQSHRRNILRKVGVRGIAGLVRWHEERLRW